MPDLLKILGQFHDFLDSRASSADAHPGGHITVTGGEPFLRKDFLDLLDALAAAKPRVSFAILTNGTCIDAAMAARLRKLGPRFVQVSIDGSRDVHDKIRGCGTFDRAVEGLRHLVQQHIPTLISFTAHRGNFREFPKVAELGVRLGVCRVWADRMIPFGRGSAMESLTPDETREFIALLADARRRQSRRWFGHTEIAMHRALQFLAGGHAYSCTAGDTLLAIQPNGDLYPCRRLPILIGNVLHTPLATLYSQSATLRTLRDHSRICEGCETCRNAERCRGGLRCLSYAATGELFRSDPGCWLASVTSSVAACDTNSPIY